MNVIAILCDNCNRCLFVICGVLEDSVVSAIKASYKVLKIDGEWRDFCNYDCIIEYNTRKERMGK